MEGWSGPADRWTHAMSDPPTRPRRPEPTPVTDPPPLGSTTPARSLARGRTAAAVVLALGTGLSIGFCATVAGNCSSTRSNVSMATHATDDETAVSSPTEERPNSGPGAGVAEVVVPPAEALAPAAAENPQPAPAVQFVPWVDANAPWPDDGRTTLLSFAVISDTHVGREDDGATFARVVSEINALRPRPAFVLILGDLTDTFRKEQLAEFKATRGGFEMPSHVVPGNHDESFDPPPRRIRGYERQFPGDSPPYRVDYGPLTLIGIDSQLFNERRRSPDSDELAERALQKLEKMMREARGTGQRLLLFHHIPPYPNFFRKSLKRAWQNRYLTRYLSLLRKYDVEAEFTGHFHRDELYVDEGGTLLLNVPPVCQKYTRHASFRLVRLTEDGLTYRQIYMDSEVAHLSYQLDLHGLDRKSYARWLAGISDEELLTIWRRRTAGDKDTEDWTVDLARAHFRAFLSDPFSYQPAGSEQDSESVKFDDL